MSNAAASESINTLFSRRQRAFRAPRRMHVVATGGWSADASLKIARYMQMLELQQEQPLPANGFGRLMHGGPPATVAFDVRPEEGMRIRARLAELGFRCELRDPAEPEFDPVCVRVVQAPSEEASPKAPKVTPALRVIRNAAYGYLSLEDALATVRPLPGKALELPRLEAEGLIARLAGLGFEAALYEDKPEGCELVGPRLSEIREPGAA